MKDKKEKFQDLFELIKKSKKEIGFLYYLKDRYSDEKKFENFEDYKNKIVEAFQDFKEIKIIKVTKLFHITINFQNEIYILKINKYKYILTTNV